MNISLENASLNRCIKLIVNLPYLKNPKDIEIAHKYIYENYPSHILKKMLHKIHYYQSAQVTLLFLPYLLTTGKLYLTDQNIGETIQWLEKHPELEAKLSLVFRLSINISGPSNYFKISNLLNKIPDLRIFQLFSCTSDEVLARLAMSCRNIEVFDSRDDAASTVTDAGLAFISHCKNLKIILFSNIADEYDYEDRFRFSAKGIAMLLYTLPKLKRLECPEYLLRDAFQFLYQMNISKDNHLPISSVNISFPGIPCSTISILPYLCPNITILSLYITNKDEIVIANSLKHLLLLQKLQLNIEHLTTIDHLGMSSYGNRLKWLVIRTPSITEADLALILLTCINLEVFILQVHNLIFDNITINFNTGAIPLFSKLSRLELASRVPVTMFIILNTHVTCLKALYLSNLTTEGFVTAVAAVIARGGWSYLEILVLPALSLFDSELIISLLMACPNLKLLAVSFSNHMEEAKVKVFITEYKHPVKLTDYDDIIRPSKLFDPVLEYYD